MAGMRSKGLVLCACICGVLLLPGVLWGQTDAYIVEVVEEQELQEARATIEEQTFSISQPDFSFQGPTTMREEGRIGSMRGAARSGSGGSTMLRYDQHRELSPPASSTLRIGPWFSDLGLALSAGYRYTRFSGRETDLLEGTRPGDIQEEGDELPVSATLTMNNYMLLTRRMDLSLNLRMSYYYYPLETQPDEYAIDLTDEGIYATFSTQFHPTRDSRILVYDDILYLTDFVDRRGISDRLGGREYKVFENTVGADWDWKASAADAFSASASRSDTIPQDDEFDRQRAVRYSEMAAYRRQMNQFAAAGMLVQASQSLAETEERPDTHIYGYSLFTGMNLTPTMNFNASVGQQFSRVDSAGDEVESRDSESFTGTASIDHDLQGGRSQTFRASRSIAESFEGGADITDQLGYRLSWGGLWLPGSFTSDYMIADPQDVLRNGYRNWANRFQVRTQLTRMIPLAFSASYDMRFNDEPEAAAEDGAILEDDPELEADYETLSLMVRTGFRITEKINFTAYAQQIRRMADNADLEYTRDTVGLQFTWSHQF